MAIDQRLTNTYESEGNTELKGEFVLLSVETGVSIGLSEVSTQIRKLLA